ncbi:MAG TPA: dockerin type I domain-containing protein [Terriglobales bacterium]|nr:dockerin type I domain-containing protein [Terriglobales bacterium]
MRRKYLFSSIILTCMLLSFLPKSICALYVPDFRVNTDSSIGIAQYYADIAFDPSGNFIIVYTDRGVNHDHRKVYFQRFDSLANRVGEPVLVSDSAIPSNDEPHIAMHPSGKFVIVWGAGKPDPIINFILNIYLRRYDSFGNPLGLPQKVDVDRPDTTDCANFSAEVAMDKDGNFVVVWESQEPYKGGMAYGQLFNSSGERVGNNFYISDPSACDYHISQQGEFPRVAYNSQGYFFVCWKGVYRGRSDSPNWSMGRVYTPSGQPLTKVFLLFAPGSQNYGNHVAVASNSQNNFVTAFSWNDTLWTYPNNAVAVRTFDTLGHPLDDLVVANDTVDLGDIWWMTRIAVDGQDGYVVLWQDDRAGRNLWAQRFGPDNRPIGRNYRVNIPLNSLGTPSGAGWNNFMYDLDIYKNTVGFAWVDFRNYRTYNADIYAKLLDLDKIGYYHRGDLNLDGRVDTGDVIYVLNYLFKNGWGILPAWTGDVNADGRTTVTDVIYLVNYLFKGGPDPQK